MNNQAIADIHQVLQQYWGYDRFRALQQDIIESVLSGRDTLALLPTGGGKSICFQVPAMAQEGLCLVVSPLIALMKDQVHNLKKRHIKASAIFSGMTNAEIDRTLDNCAYDPQMKFLYLSPERLHSDIFQARLPKLRVRLVAIDEAHCISQWGYDFRPAYLRIAELRERLKQVPFMALTATATERVETDILEKLQMKDAHTFRKSFKRANLSYSVRTEENKAEKAADILLKTTGSSIIYVRSRQRTQGIAEMLTQKNISADYYHAGLDAKTRSQKQDEWVRGQTRVMVCTNAFGMGIDKPDVRTVIHCEPPDSLEAYYQEAGRAGRDEQKAFAVMLFNQSDLLSIKNNIEKHLPPVEAIKQTYQALADHYQIAIGAGEGQSFPFQILQFCKQYQLQASLVQQCLKVLEEQNLVSVSDAVFMPSRLRMLINNEQIYKIYLSQPRIEPYLKAILHTYGGVVFESYVSINEEKLAQILSQKFNYAATKEHVCNALAFMQQQKWIEYAQQTDQPSLTFVAPRANAHTMKMDLAMLRFRQEVYEQKAKAVANYLNNAQTCRTVQLVDYFGEHHAQPCGVCDVCIDKKRQQKLHLRQETLQQTILQLLQKQDLHIDAIMEYLTDKAPLHFAESEIALCIRWLCDKQITAFDSKRKLQLLDK